MKNSAGYDVSGANGQGLDALEQGLHELRCYIGDPVASVERALAASPELVMGHVLKAYLYLMGTEPAGLPVARAAHEAALARGRQGARGSQRGVSARWARAAGRPPSRFLHGRLARAA